MCIDFGDLVWDANSKFPHFFLQLSARDMSIFSFPDDNFSKCPWIFIKLGLCIYIMEIWFAIANGQILSVFDRLICPQHICIFVSG